MNQKRTTALFAALALALALSLGLSACGGSSGDSSSTAASTPTAKEPTTKPAASSDGLTPPGTMLPVGKAATVGWVPPASFDPTVEEKGYKLELSVDAIEKGSIDDFANVELEADQKTSTPYYMHITIKALEDIPASVTDDPDVSVTALDDRNQEQGSITFFGEFEKCNDNEPPKPFASGSSYESCLAYLVPGGGSIQKAEWDDGPAAAEEVTPYFEEPIVWSGS